MSDKATRYLDAGSKIEVRKQGDGKRVVSGMIPYNSRSEVMWGFVEVIDPSAFRKTLSDGAEVYAFWAHDSSEILASRSAGTLRLENKPEGLYFEIDMRDTAISEDRWAAIERGDVSGVSFGFNVEREEWDHAVEPALRTLKEVRLLEISPGVAFPAYPGAQSAAALRSLVAETGLNLGDVLAKRKAPQNMEPKPEPIAPEPAPAPPSWAPEERARAEMELGLIAAECGISID